MADDKTPAPKGSPQIKIYLGPTAGNGMLRHGQHISFPMDQGFQDFLKANPNLNIPTNFSSLEDLIESKRTIANR